MNPSHQPVMSPAESVAGSWWNTFGALALSTVTAVAYLEGLATLAFFAGGLGVSPSDLGLDFRDYVVMAGINVAVWGITFGLVLLIRKVEVRVLPNATGWRRLLRFVVTLPFGMAAFVLVIIMGGLTATASGLWPVVVVGSLFIGATDPYPAISAKPSAAPPAWTRTRTGRIITDARFLPGCLVLIVSTTAALVGANQWANDLKSVANTGDRPGRGPMALALVVNPERGVVRNGDGEEACVVRVTDSVFVGGETVIVTEVDSFAVRACVPDDRPFDL
jgi:hypothetical protein